MARSKYKVANMTSLPQDDLVEAPIQEAIQETVVSEETTAEDAVVKHTKHVGQTGRSKRYQEALAKVDRTKLYPVEKAVKLLKELPQPKFDATVEVHIVAKENIASVDVAYPHSTGKTVRVAVFSTDLIPELEKGTISFDVLLATPADMSKLTKFAKLLGPKGLMPNPKSGTLTADVAKRKKDLESGKTTIRGEKKSPLLHTTIGKLSMSDEALSQNITALISACGQGKVLKATICTSMSPGIKVQL